MYLRGVPTVPLLMSNPLTAAPTVGVLAIKSIWDYATAPREVPASMQPTLTPAKPDIIQAPVFDVATLPEYSRAPQLPDTASANVPRGTTEFSAGTFRPAWYENKALLLMVGGAALVGLVLLGGSPRASSPA